jgi:hypothetical protein
MIIQFNIFIICLKVNFLYFIKPNMDVTYYYTRVNMTIPDKLEIESKRQFYFKALDSIKATKTEGDHKYMILNLLREHYNNEFFITGILVRIANKQISTADLDTKKNILQKISNAIEIENRFFLHPETGILIFNAAYSKKEFFEHKFKELLNLGISNSNIEIEIDTINETKTTEFFQKLKDHRVMQIKFELRPSNPNFNPHWKTVDDRLRKLGITKYTEIYETKKKDGQLNLAEDSEIEQKIEMASDGYGKAEGKYLEKKKYHIIKTSESPITAQAPNDGEVNYILKRLYHTFDLILGRFIKPKK